MPTVLRFAGLRIVIYPNDHAPAHVHAIADDCEAVFELRCPNGPATLRTNYGFGRREATRARAAVQSELAMLCRKWMEIHGRK